jgi:site-specific recombinase XerD
LTNSLTIHQPSTLSANLADDPWQRAYALWLASFKSENTRTAYKTAWGMFYTATGLHAGAVDHEHVRAWKFKLEKDNRPATVNQYMSALSSFYKFVNRNYAYLRDDNPCANVQQLKVNPYGKATLLVDDQDVILLQSIDRDTFEGFRDYAMLLLFLTTGVRLAAIANAKNATVRRQGAVLYFHYVGKGDKEFTKRLPTNTAKAILEWLISKPDYDGSLFGMTRRQIQHMVIKRCDAAFGVGHGITVHSLRHTAANNAAKSGSVQDVRALLDHESTRVTAIYLDHITQEQGERLSEALDSRYD